MIFSAIRATIVCSSTLHTTPSNTDSNTRFSFVRLAEHFAPYDSAVPCIVSSHCNGERIATLIDRHLWRRVRCLHLSAYLGHISSLSRSSEGPCTSQEKIAAFAPVCFRTGSREIAKVSIIRAPTSSHDDYLYFEVITRLEVSLPPNWPSKQVPVAARVFSTIHADDVKAQYSGKLLQSRTHKSGL